MSEQWAALAIDPRYKVSSFGRMVGARGSLLKPTKLKVGYLSYTIGDQRRYVHRLVMEAFGPPKPSDGWLVVRHLDDDKTNNRIDNLAWGFQSDNHADAVRNGRIAVGEMAAHAKLTAALIDRFRAERESGRSYCAMAREMGMHWSSVRNAILGKTYRKRADNHGQPQTGAL